MAFYESTFITRQDLSKQDVSKLTDQFAEIMKTQGGTVVKNEYWGLRSLAYRVAKNRKGHYTMLGIDASPEAVKELERNMRLNEDVIRALTIRVEAIDENPSAILSQGRSRDDEYEGGEYSEAAQA